MKHKTLTKGILISLVLFFFFIPAIKAPAGSKYDVIVPIEYNTETAVTPPSSGGGGGSWISSCGNKICEYPETYINCPSDCNEVFFILKPEEGFNASVPAGEKIVCFSWSYVGCPIVIENYGADTINVTVNITRFNDSSHEWAFFVEPNGTKVNETVVVVPNLSTSSVAVAVAVPNGTEKGVYRFGISFKAGDKERMFRYQVNVIDGGLESIYLWLSHGTELESGFVWRNWYTLILIIVGIIAVFVVWYSVRKPG